MQVQDNTPKPPPFETYVNVPLGQQTLAIPLAQARALSDWLNQTLAELDAVRESQETGPKKSPRKRPRPVS